MGVGKQIAIVTGAALAWAIATSVVSACFPGAAAFLGAIALAGAALLVGDRLVRPGMVRWNQLAAGARPTAGLRMLVVIVAGLAFSALAVMSVVVPALGHDASDGSTPPASERFVDELVFLSPLVVVIGVFGGIGRAMLHSDVLASARVSRGALDRSS